MEAQLHKQYHWVQGLCENDILSPARDGILDRNMSFPPILSPGRDGILEELSRIQFSED